MGEKPRLVIVEWEDTTSIAAWQDKAEVATMATNRAWHCRNVGWLVHEDDECVIVAARVTDDGEYAGLTERVPKRAIVAMADVPKLPAAVTLPVGATIEPVPYGAF